MSKIITTNHKVNKCISTLSFNHSTFHNSENRSLNSCISSISNCFNTQQINDIPQLSQNRRIILPCLIQVSSLPQVLNNEQILKSSSYFGKYGAIEKIILSVKHSTSQYKKSIRAYVTFKDKKDAAFAIAALRNFQFGMKKVKATYGTTRYCPRFIQNKKCYINGCYFLHEIDDQSHEKALLFQTIQNQYKKVNQIIDQNIEYFLNKQYEQFLREKNNHLANEIFLNENGIQTKLFFPSYQQTFDSLIRLQVICPHELSIAKNRIKLKLKNSFEIQDILAINHSLQDKKSESIQLCDAKTDTSFVFLDEKRLNILSLKCSKTKKLKQQKDQRRGQEYKLNLTSLIIKKLLKETVEAKIHKPSKFSFVGKLSMSQVLSEQNKLKAIIQKYLI